MKTATPIHTVLQNPGLTSATTPIANNSAISPDIAPLTDITGLRTSGIFPKGREPSIRTLREWTKRRRIPHHRLGHFVYYDLSEVSTHIRSKLLVPARN